MKNPFKRKKENSDKWLRIGNFLLGEEKNATGMFVVCKTLAQNWSVRWRDDTMMFGLVKELMGNKDAKDYLHSLITISFVASTYPHDLVSLGNDNGSPFMDGFYELVKNQNEYEVSVAPKATKKEHDKALKDVKELTEITEKIVEAAKEEKEND